MKFIVTIPVLILYFDSYLCHENINIFFEKINQATTKFNAKAAEIAWESSIEPGNPELPGKAATYQSKRITWQQKTCDTLATLDRDQSLNDTQKRQAYILCRGPKFTFDEARDTSVLYEELQSIYSDAEICLPRRKYISKDNLLDMEDAIFDHITAVKQLSNPHQNDIVNFAAKIAMNKDLQKNKALCLRGEKDFEKLMVFSRNEKVLRWLWIAWREKVGPPMKLPYKRLVQIENVAAIRNGYEDIGASWRQELEIPNLRQLCHRLYEEIKPLYTLLHGVVRFYLRRHYGDVVPVFGPIPAHLLGSLWSQNWEPLADMIVSTINLDESIKKLNWTVLHMAKRTEDFYQSLGLPPMTDTFWQKSLFAREKYDTARCHGTAADMFKDGDFRMIYCSGTSAEDLYVLHHEMGHIQYYMAYEHQPGIFRQANAAFHETIGDTLMYGVMTPQHLHRLGLINDYILYSTHMEVDKATIDIDAKTNNDPIKDKSHNNLSYDMAPTDIDKQENANNDIEDYIDDTDLTVEISTDEILMLKLALNKLPHIPFSLLIDEYRWKYFEGSLDKASLNKEFWDMAVKVQGIAPPGQRGEEYFDIGAKFHVPDNTPYIRYFLSSFLQHQLYESLCKTAVFGRRNAKEDLPDTITMNRCDIYGSKAVGKLLKDFMSRGNSQHWGEILLATTGNADISASALKRYYRPLVSVLKKLVRKHRIPIGW